MGTMRPDLAEHTYAGDRVRVGTACGFYFLQHWFDLSDPAVEEALWGLYSIVAKTR